MKFLIDAQLPPLMAVVLREMGYQAAHVAEQNNLTASDEDIWRQALSEDWVIVSKDEDFAERAALNDPAPRIVWIRWGNLRNRALLGNVRILWVTVSERLQAGETLVEVR